VADLYWSNVSLLLQPEGTHGSQVFEDVSPVGFTLTAVNEAQIDTSQTSVGAASLRLDGIGDYLAGSGGDLTALQLPGDFTIEFFAWKSGNGQNGYDTVLSTYSDPSATDGWAVELSGTRGFYFYGHNAAQSGSELYVDYSTNPNDSAWHHYAIDRDGGTLRMYVDGAVVASVANSRNMQAAKLEIGQDLAFYADTFAGYIQQLRVTKGVARYAGAFTPPTDPFEVGGAATNTEHDATSLNTTAFGVPSAGAAFKARSLATSRFGTPYITEPRVFDAASLSTTRFGRQAVALRSRPATSPPHRHFHAASLNSTRFGTPTLED
jgi:hypothetical protein